MSSKTLSSRKSSSLRTSLYRSKKLPLRAVLIVPFVLEVVIAVGLTGYLSFRNGQQSVNQLASQLLDEISTHIEQQLDSYLATARQTNQSNADAIRLGILPSNDLQKLGIFFWTQVQTHGFSHVSFKNSQGAAIGAGYTRGIWHIADNSQSGESDTNIYSVDKWGNRAYLFGVPKEESSGSNDWYAAAVRARKQTWSPIQIEEDRPTQVRMAVSTPIFDRSNQLIGVTRTDLSLRKIHQFLSKLHADKNATVFIVERSGLLVESSSDKPIYRRMNGTTKRLNPANDWGTLMSATTEHLTQTYGDLKQIDTSQQLTFTWDENRQFVQVTPYRDELGLDWLVIVTVPESDFMGEMHNNNHITILLCAFALVGAIGLGLLTSYWIASPILRLSKASRELALGKLDYSVPEASWIAELEMLAHSFNQMTEHLHQSFDEVTVALQESEEKFTKVFRTSPDPIAISTLEGKFLEVNSSFLTVFGYSKEEVVGHMEKEIGLWAQIEEREKLVRNLQKTGAICNLEYNFYSRSGELLTMLFSSELIELNGQVCVLGVAKDISGRKQAEEALRQSEQRFRGAFTTSAIGIVISSPEGNLLQANPSFCEMLGHAESDLLKLTFQEITYAEDLQKDLEHTRQLLAGEIPYFHIQKRYRHRTGKIVWGFLSVSLVRDLNQQPLYVVAQIQNMTDRKRTEAKLKAQQEFLQQVIDVVPGSILVKNWKGNFISLNQVSTELSDTPMEDSSDDLK
ncbi:MAG: PAS domain S-box protein [Kovacikia sp.]